MLEPKLFALQLGRRARIAAYCWRGTRLHCETVLPCHGVKHTNTYIPVRAVGSGTEFDNEIWYELISTIKTVNNLPVEDRDTPLEKSDLKDGDRVTVEYEGKTFEGVVDLESLSPPDSPAERTPSKLPADSKAWKRKRVCPTRYRDEIAAPKPKKRLVEKKSGM